MPDQPTGSPQPWRVDDSGYIRGADGRLIAWVEFRDLIGGEPDTGKANADLIIAAGPMRDQFVKAVDLLRRWLVTTKPAGFARLMRDMDSFLTDLAERMNDGPDNCDKTT